MKKRIRSIKKNPKDNTIMPIWGNFGGVYSILWVLRNCKTKLAKAIFRNKIIKDEGKVVDSPLNTFTFFSSKAFMFAPLYTSGAALWLTQWEW